ncbi:arf-GAP with Rho-GAP domain, ANK repeat and PH domain-containing protein 1-like [Rousettus aegyptiacus]|uniref:arf-GAP with Rho-GAP domain, ANK repeat and PH domain-containing protein 1-like n=1 Tax=Rousettus aegyptiacus TaxID=9407 RepID=UPI00168CB601|nr:arf-GAP with Rho-GAP domain, ANK repeat and PH domain-containing protein 1-like [Rousettus aegyptiacus]
MAFKVFNAREEMADRPTQARLQQKVSLQTQALVAALRPMGGGAQSSAACGTRPKAAPPGACFKCDKDGHWAHQCPNPRPPTKPCPQCKQPGHWKSDCPDLPRPSAPPRGGEDEGQHPVFELLGLAEDRRGPGSGTPVTLAEPRVMLQVAKTDHLTSTGDPPKPPGPRPPYSRKRGDLPVPQGRVLLLSQRISRKQPDDTNAPFPILRSRECSVAHGRHYASGKVAQYRR